MQVVERFREKFGLKNASLMKKPKVYSVRFCHASIPQGRRCASRVSAVDLANIVMK